MYSKSVVELLPSLNSDAGICDAARVSFAKRAENFTDEENKKLLRYLWKHKHWSPFGHAREAFRFSMNSSQMLQFLSRANCASLVWTITNNQQYMIQTSLWGWCENAKYLPINCQDTVNRSLSARYPLCADMFEKAAYDVVKQCLFTELDEVDSKDFATLSFRIKAPIFVARQLVKHQVGLCWNEESRRYIDSTPEFYNVQEFRARPDGSIKQGSAGAHVDQGALHTEYETAVGFTGSTYHDMIDMNVAPEQARMVLPLSMMTTWIWTGSVAAFKRVCNLRLDAHAQAECREVAVMIDSFCRQQYPNTWAALDNA